MKYICNIIDVINEMCIAKRSLIALIYVKREIDLQKLTLLKSDALEQIFIFAMKKRE